MSNEDWWLDPPDEPRFSECERCSVKYDPDNLARVGSKMLCAEYEEKHQEEVFEEQDAEEECA